MKRNIARVSGATLGYIAGNLPGAYIGYKIGDEVGKSYPNKKQMAPITPKKTPRKGVAKKSSRAGARKLSFSGSKKKLPDTSAVFSRGGKMTKRKDSFMKVQKAGVQINFEKVGVQTATEALYIIHNNMPLDQVLNLTCAAWLKKLMNKMGISLASFIDSVVFAGTSTRIEFAYKVSNVAALTLVKLDPTAKTFLQVFGLIVNAFYGNASYSAAWVPVYLRAYYVTGATDADNMTLATVTLAGGHCVFKSTSWLKIQNRSVSDISDTNTEDLDRVPLTVKGYQGPGNGTRLKSRSDLPGLYADNITGVGGNSFPIIGAYADLGGDYSEPLGPQFFMDATKSSNFKLLPGNIFTSKIVGTQKLSLDKIGTIVENPTSVEKRSCGKFKMYAFDKTISLSGTESSGLKVAYEHQVFIGCYYVEPAQVGTRPYAVKYT